MTTEITIGCLIALAGFGGGFPARKWAAGPAWMWLSIPIGMALFLFSSLGLIVFTGTLNPSAALACTLVLGALAALAGVMRRKPNSSDLRWIGVGIGLVALTVLLARIWHLTRLSPDSLRYLLAADDLVKPEALAEVNQADLLIRQIGLPSLQTLSHLTDRQYLASLGPLFAIFGLGLFVWFTSLVSVSIDPKRRRWLVGSSLVFLLSSNRLVYDAFYINTHIQMAVYLLIAVVGLWLAVSRDLAGWALPAGIALAATVLLRPESPLIVAVVLVSIGASRADWPIRIMATVPVALVMSVWYGVVLWNNARRGDLVSLEAPVFGSLVAVFGAALVVILGGIGRLRPLTRYLDIVALVGLSGLLALYGARSPQILVESAVSTAQNLTYNGLWLLTWGAVTVLLVVAFIVHRVADSRLWTVPIVGFGLVFWLLPLIRDGAWRVGAGDSGNRILAHILLVAVAFLVVASQEGTSGRPEVAAVEE